MVCRARYLHGAGGSESGSEDSDPFTATPLRICKGMELYTAAVVHAACRDPPHPPHLSPSHRPPATDHAQPLRPALPSRAAPSPSPPPLLHHRRHITLRVHHTAPARLPACAQGAPTHVLYAVMLWDFILYRSRHAHPADLQAAQQKAQLHAHHGAVHTLPPGLHSAAYIPHPPMSHIIERSRNLGRERVVLLDDDAQLRASMCVRAAGWRLTVIGTRASVCLVSGRVVSAVRPRPAGPACALCTGHCACVQTLMQGWQAPDVRDFDPRSAQRWADGILRDRVLDAQRCLPEGAELVLVTTPHQQWVRHASRGPLRASIPI
jgi:hypothetical protein